MFVEALREDYDWLADSLEEESATSHYEIDTRNLTKSAEKCAYESKFDSFKEQNIKVGHRCICPYTSYVSSTSIIVH